MPRAGTTAGAGMAAPVVHRRLSHMSIFGVVQMCWLVALNKIELALLVVSAGMIAAGLLSLLAMVPVLLAVSSQ